MICERYRESLMALLDNELSPSERRSVELHLQECHECRSEFEKLQQLSHQLSALRFPTPQADVWSNYYQGVCARMQRRARWDVWGAAAVALLVVGNVLFFALPASALSIGLGATAVVGGAVILWLTYYCNCS